ncbi:oligosaccharide flippase family protein [Acidithiobacillus sp. AMEEHan]|uniref:oligosaccharide flippase family protein n=1 Tax=Acidithiobacillus sp. AMEEHan TaxID=2994951 RepID=UPI0027E4A0DD|nr:oligosaccharide flippase family protein [Acidithiobacillus sp. AMEEHan]
MARSIAHSTLLNVSGRAIPAFLLLFTVPLYLHLIGVARYGALSILWLALGYFGAFDLGLGRAVAQRISKIAAQKKVSDPLQLRAQGELFWTALLATLAASSLASILLFWPLMIWLVRHVLVLSQELRQEVQHAILPLLLFLPLATSLSVLLGTLEGRERFDYLNIGQIVGLLLYQVFPLSAAFLGYITLPYLVGAAIFGRLLGSLLLFRFCIRILDGPFPTFHWKLLRSILPYGAWITVSAVVSPIMNLTDRFFIGAQLGMSFVARYVVPFNLVMYGGILPQSLATALFPRYASLEDDEARVTMFTAMRMLAATISPLSGC